MPSGKLEGQSAPWQQTANTSCSRFVMYDGPHGQRQWPGGVWASLVASQLRPSAPPQVLPSGHTWRGSAVGSGSQNTASGRGWVSGPAAPWAAGGGRQRQRRRARECSALPMRKRRRGWDACAGSARPSGVCALGGGAAADRGEEIERTRLAVGVRAERDRRREPREAAHRHCRVEQPMKPSRPQDCPRRLL